LTLDVLKQNGVPIYYQLKEIFIEKIETGEWGIGDSIPNELDLCKQYGVSRGPVRMALDILTRMGIITRKQGKGTFVLPPKLESELISFYSFTSLIRQAGLIPSSKILDFSLEKVKNNIAKYLNINTGDSCHKIIRLRLANDNPLILETIYVPQVIAPTLSQSNVASRSLNEILSTDYAAIPVRARQFFEPSIADEYEATKLSVLKGAPVLLIQNTTFDTKDRTIIFSKAIMRGDRVRYFVDLNTKIDLPTRKQATLEVISDK